MPAFDVLGLSLSDKKVMDSYEQFRGCKGYRCMKVSKVSLAADKIFNP